MKKLAFITSQDDPTLIQDDQLAIAPLRERGYSVAPLVWDDPSQDVDNFDGLIFRSCWNYHQKFDQFQTWLNDLRKYEGPVLNPIDISFWNLNKKYLLELESKGASIPRTEWIAKGTRLNQLELQTVIEKIGSDKLVIKPAVSLNGHDTYLVSAKDLSRITEILSLLPKDRDVLIQEYIPEITTSGEVSLIFFEQEFSHAIRKTASKGEFRIHSEYGGLRESINPSSELIAQAADIVKMVETPLLFSRVDVVERAQGASLIELEIIDPMLFLGSSEGAPSRFADAIVRRIKQF